MPSHVRPPAVAGQFYPGQPEELKSVVEDLLSRAPEADCSGHPVALVVPHAGYPYSGQTAAAAYKQIRDASFDTVVLAAPSHFEPCHGVSVYAGGAYETPLGLVEVDMDFAARLADDHIHLSMEGHRVQDQALSSRLRGEHAVEVQLPFLQVILDDFKIVPIVMDERTPALCEHLANVIAREAEGRNILLVASSDLYHGEDYAACVDSDHRTLDIIDSYANRTKVW